MNTWQTLYRKFRFYSHLLLHRQTPLYVKMLLGLGLMYLVYPLDFITDFIPFLGLVDDVTIGALLIGLALRLIPEELIASVHHKVYGESDES